MHVFTTLLVAAALGLAIASSYPQLEDAGSQCTSQCNREDGDVATLRPMIQPYAANAMDLAKRLTDPARSKSDEHVTIGSYRSVTLNKGPSMSSLIQVINTSG